MTQTPAGWYPDPYAPGQPVQRYWDGTSWTASTAAMSMPQSSAGSYAVKTTPDGQILSGWWMRVAAYLLDDLFASLISMPFTLPLIIPLFRGVLDRIDQQIQQAGQAGATPPTFSFYTAHELATLAEISLIQMVVIVLYNVLFLRWKSATPGKLLLGLRVRLRATPGPLPWGTIWARVLVQYGYGFAAALPYGGGLAALFPLLDDLWPLWDTDKQAIHEKWAKTNVVRHNRWVQAYGVERAPDQVF